jgi:hypothetical protein
MAATLECLRESGPSPLPGKTHGDDTNELEEGGSGKDEKAGE